MQGTEEYTKKKIDETIKNRVWEHISPTRLTSLREIVISEFSHSVLGPFEDSEIGAMLINHRATGSIGNLELSARLRANFQRSQESIKEKVIQEAMKMRDTLVQDTMHALQQEGIIPLPEGKAAFVIPEGKDPEK